MDVQLKERKKKFCEMFRMKKFYYLWWKILDKLNRGFKHNGIWDPPKSSETNRWLTEAIKSGKPFCMLRPGNEEYKIVVAWDEHLLFKTEKYKKLSMFAALGDEASVKQWTDQFKKDLQEADVLAIYKKEAYMEHYMVNIYAKSAKKMLRFDIDDWFDEAIPWLNALEGKKVMIVSPFVELIREQYEKRKLIWGKKNILPNMELKLLKSVWFVDKEDNGGFNSWFDALDSLIQEAKEIDFDVAIIGCSHFSTFLAAEFKRWGKQAIQYGGVLQMLFGIRGERWDNDPEYHKYHNYYNEYWVRPSKDEAPKKKKLLDKGCYW